MEESSKSYLGTGWGFPPSFDKLSKGIKLTSDQEDIEKSLEILLTTRLGERFLEPDYGCDLSDLVFDPQNVSEPYIKDLVHDAILFHEPRIELEKVDVTSMPQDGSIVIDIVYTVLTTNTRYNFVYPFYKEEGTNL